MNELKPCPFCGSSSVSIIPWGYASLELVVFCNSCKTYFGNEHYEEEEDKLREWWNTVGFCFESSCFKPSQQAGEMYAEGFLQGAKYGLTILMEKMESLEEGKANGS